MQCACTIHSSVSCSVLKYFSTLCHIKKGFRKKLFNQNMFRVSIQLLSEMFFIISRIERDMRKMYIGLHVKYPFYFDCNETYFLDRFSKIHQISNLMKISPVGAELFHADGQTGRHGEANSGYLQFCESAK